MGFFVATGKMVADLCKVLRGPRCGTLQSHLDSVPVAHRASSRLN